MELYAGLDLHSRNTYIWIMGETSIRVFKKRVSNDLDQILQTLKPFKKRLKVFVVESTYNWYWLVDGHLNPTLKYLWLIIFFAVLIWSGINPKDYYTWFLEVVPALIGLIILAATYNRFRFTTLAYLLILIHCIILMVGGHYTYAEVPLFDWIRDWFDVRRSVARAALDDNFGILFSVPRKSVVNSLVAVLLRMVAWTVFNKLQ